MLAIYLALKEIWHSKGRFLLIGLIVALITTLVLFIAALAEGLGNGNREYIQKLNGELLVYQANVDLSIPSSRIGRSTLNALRRVEGVADVGQVFFADATVVFADGQEDLDISLLGVEPGRPGEPAARQGHGLGRSRSNEVVIDGNIAARRQVKVGDTLRIKVTQGTDEEFYDLTVVGISDGRQYFLRPSIFVPYLTWDKVRPKGETEGSDGELVSNIAVVKLRDANAEASMAARLTQEVAKIQVVDRVTAYEATPGYSAQQSTLDTQRYFTFFIGILVIGGFFQIQTLQKVAQIGMLKAIGASNWTIALAAITQIVAINALGVVLGAAGSLLLGASFPPGIPIVFTGDAVATAVAALMLIGPAGGLVSVWALLKIEPLTALGLAQ
ncbi:MAG: ABC transporter permease [Caldilineaceae bacterium]|nr:ABC transporter permease [Caldilineaceae bacterium]